MTKSGKLQGLVTQASQGSRSQHNEGLKGEPESGLAETMLRGARIPCLRPEPKPMKENRTQINKNNH